jgi:HAMP domain-containing protein
MGRASWIVLLLGLIQIRRNLVPLAKLQQATRRISLGQFQTRVTITSGDEFEELASSFNSMADKIEKQLLQVLTASHKRSCNSSKTNLKFRERANLTKTHQLSLLLGRLHFDLLSALWILRARIPSRSPLLYRPQTAAASRSARSTAWCPRLGSKSFRHPPESPASTPRLRTPWRTVC